MFTKVGGKKQRRLGWEKGGGKEGRGRSRKESGGRTVEDGRERRQGKARG